MASYGSGPVIVPLYGVVVRDILATGDKDLISAVQKVSAHLLSKAEGEVSDWKAAHSEIAKALG